MRIKAGTPVYLLFLFSATYGLAMLALNGTQSGGLYSAFPYHRLQAEALLHGHFYLSNDIRDLQPGLAWQNGGVQQVWGLGVGLWLLPFQGIWHVSGGQIFPDRVGLGMALALLAFYAGQTGLKAIGQVGRAVSGGFVLLVVLCPPLWTLARVSDSVFEQTILYSVILSLGILVSLVRIIWFTTRVDFVICFVLSALTIWMRPTHTIYGITAAVICSLVLILRFRAVGPAILGIASFLASCSLLAWTNYERFGSVTEFGHRLTVSTPNMVFLTRFGNPFQATPPLDATKELAGLMFLDFRVRDANAFSENLFPGQAASIRWRKINFTVFDSSYPLTVLLASIGLGFRFVRYLRTANHMDPGRPDDPLLLCLFLWSLISAIGLGWFYLYYPAIASRYICDFIPAFVGFATTLWLLVTRDWSRYLLPVLVIWLVGEIVSAKAPVFTPRAGNVSDTDDAAPKIQGRAVEEFGGSYTLSNHPQETSLSWNGRGWDSTSGYAPDIVALIVDHPEYVELRLEERRPFNGEPAGNDEYQAMIGGVLLPLRTVTKETDGVSVVFQVPSVFRVRPRREVLFLCFSSGYDARDRESERILYSVRWR